VRVVGLGYFVEVLRNEHVPLIIDDVFDTGRSVETLLRELERQCEGNMPETVRIATVYYKPKRNRTEREPDYNVHETDDWLVFPHELEGLSEDEIRLHKPNASMILGGSSGV
jgi:hypoxanthine phosphoribosyltransferase